MVYITYYLGSCPHPTAPCEANSGNFNAGPTDSLKSCEDKCDNDKQCVAALWNGPDTGIWKDIFILQQIEAYSPLSPSKGQTTACKPGKTFPTCNNYCPNIPCSLPQGYSASRLSGPKPIHTIGSIALDSNAFYVDAVKGLDTNDGSIDAPFQTLTAAQKAAQHLHQSLSSNTPITIYLRETGPFALTEPLVLTPSDSFTNWQSYPSENAIISGGLVLKNLNWTQADQNGTWQTPVPAGLLDHHHTDKQTKMKQNKIKN